MKRIFSCLLFCLMASVAAAAEAQWLTSLPEAQEQARKEHKLVLMNFTGSDWCPYCIQLDKKVLETSEFSDYASKHLVLVVVDFPRSKPQPSSLKMANDALQEKYKISGYPTLVLVKPDGTKVWDNVGYDGESPSEMIAKLQSASPKS